MDELTVVREQKVEGIGPWVWPATDEGAWLGPSQEFALIRDHMLPFVKERRLIVQAGGCCGMYPRLWSEIFPSVYTFEPAPLNWYCLVKNCPSENIVKFNAAIGEYQEKNWLALGHNSNVGTNRIQYEEGSLEIDMINLDSLNLPYCDAIQLDIEGYEPAALLGAARTIQTYMPVISLETRDQNDASHMLLSTWGYRISSVTVNDTIFVPI